MATYLQNVTDAVTVLNPPDPGLQFNMQLLQMRQSKYDQAHAKLSKMYGTILSSGLTRDDNIAAREEFFKLVEGDLQKIAGMDLSLDSNVNKAQNVFKQFYTNNYIVKDMVWTKNYQSQMRRADAFKNCVDHTKCGGMYWEDGEKFMQYKRQEFKNASADEALGAQDVRYIPYNNMMEEALKDLKEMGGFNFTQDVISGDDYQYTTKNGNQITQPMLLMYKQLYEKNPEFHDMYKVMAYNQRNDWMYNRMQSGEFKTLNEAAVGYTKAFKEEQETLFNNRSAEITHDKDQLKQLLEGYEEDEKAGKLTQDDVKKYEEIQFLYKNALDVDGYNQIYKNAQKNMHSQQSLNNLTDYLDDITSANLFNGELIKTVDSLKWKDYEQTIKLEEKAKMRIEHEYDVALENLEFAHNKELEVIKAELKAALDTPDFKADSFETAQSYEVAREDVYTYAGTMMGDILDDIAQKKGGEWDAVDDLKKITENPNLSRAEKLKQVRAGITDVNVLATFNNSYKEAETTLLAKKRTSNRLALTYVEKQIGTGGVVNTPVLFEGAPLDDYAKKQLKTWAQDYPNSSVLVDLSNKYAGTSFTVGGNNSSSSSSNNSGYNQNGPAGG
jgi:hypothetical protein